LVVASRTLPVCVAGGPRSGCIDERDGVLTDIGQTYAGQFRGLAGQPVTVDCGGGRQEEVSVYTPQYHIYDAIQPWKQVHVPRLPSLYASAVCRFDDDDDLIELKFPTTGAFTSTSAAPYFWLWLPLSAATALIAGLALLIAMLGVVARGLGIFE
jgi:hypothetical protein